MSVKLRHPTLKDVNFVVIHDREFDKAQDVCPACKVVHVNKAYHLRLDSSGEVTVSDDVYERLAQLDKLPLTKVGKDPFPKPQVVGVPEPDGAANMAIRERLPKRLQEAVDRAQHDVTLPVQIIGAKR